jgi:Holliday junction resolvase
MTGGRASRLKGNRAERRAVSTLQEAGLAAERIPLSGSAGGSFSGDISCPILGIDRRIEVKCRATDFALIRRWLAEHYALILRTDRQDDLIVMRLSDFGDLAYGADRKRLEAAE